MVGQTVRCLKHTFKVELTSCQTYSCLCGVFGLSWPRSLHPRWLRKTCFGCHRYISINAMNRFGQRNVFSAHDAALIFWSNSNFPQLTRQRLERYCCRFVKVHLLIRPCRNSRMTFSSAWQFPRASATCPGVLAMSHGNCVSRCTEEAGWDIFPMIFLRIKKRS